MAQRRKQSQNETSVNYFSPAFWQTNKGTNFLIGLAVILILIAGIVFINKNSRNQPTPNTTQNQTQATDTHKHVVKQGEDLWTIAEVEYKDGYKWVEIAKVNNISNPGQINVGQELVIPVLAQNGSTPTTKPTENPTKATTHTPSLTITPMPTQKPSEIEQGSTSSTSSSITENTYTVKAGDDLWDIAERAYGDGYKWVEIARANKLENPSIIHSGNVLSLPR